MTTNQTESLHATRAGNVPASLIPLLLFAGVVVVLAIGLTLNPREVPSPLVGKPVPEFALPPVKGRALGLSSADLGGRVAIDWGVYGVPETFVIDRDGRIAYKFIGPITPDVLEKKLRPLIAGLRSGRAAAESRRGGSQ